MTGFLWRCVFIGALVLTGVGSVAAAPPPIDAYGKLPGVEQASLSPSGARFALIGRVGDSRKIIVGELGGKALFATSIGAAKIRSVRWAGDDHLLITQSKTVNLGPFFTVSRHELSTTLVVNVQSRKAIPVFEGHNEVSNIVFGQYGAAKIGDHWYGYFGGVTYGFNGAREYMLDHTYPDLYRVDLDTGALSRVGQGSDISDDWLVGPDGAVIARSTYNETSGEWGVFIGQWGGKRLAAGQSRFGGAGLYRGRDENTLLIQRPTEQGAVYEEAPIAGGEARPVPDNSLIDDLMFDRTKGLWAGFTIKGDIPEPECSTRKSRPGSKARERRFPINPPTSFHGARTLAG